MLPYSILLQYLLYMNPAIGLDFGLVTENCFVFNSGAPLKTCNRVCHQNIPTDYEIQRIKYFFDSVQFTWFVDVLDIESQEVLKKNGLKNKASFPSMILDLASFEPHDYSQEIDVQEIDIMSSDLEGWITVVSHAFHSQEHELSQMIDVFADKIPQALKLYLGFYQGIAVSAGMFIDHGDVVSLHWIGTLSEHRHKGAGTALTSKALVDFQNSGCRYAILTATSNGKPMYERMGFKEFARYDVYGNF